MPATIARKDECGEYRGRQTKDYITHAVEKVLNHPILSFLCKQESIVLKRIWTPASRE
jgi:hypothetical protein